MKYKIVCFLLILLFFTGCTKNELVCSKKLKNAGYIYNENYNLIYDDNGENLNKINIIMEYEYNDRYTEEEISEDYLEATKYCDFYESGSSKLIECDSKLDDKVLNVNVVIKVNQISDELFEDIMYVTKDEIDNLKDTKKMLENVGYNCK